MKKLGLILLAFVLTGMLNVQSAAALVDAPKTGAATTPAVITGCGANKTDSCDPNGSQKSNTGVQNGKSGGGALQDAQSYGVTNTKTTVPDPLSGTLCEDLLGCKDKNLNGMYLKPGVQQSYAYRIVIPQIIKLMLTMGGGIAVLMLVYAGYLYLTSMGEDKAMQKAVKIIGFSLGGLIIMVLSRAIVAIVENLPLG